LLGHTISRIAISHESSSTMRAIVNRFQPKKSFKEPHIAPESFHGEHWPPTRHPFQQRPSSAQTDITANIPHTEPHSFTREKLASGDDLLIKEEEDDNDNNDEDDDDSEAPEAEPKILLAPETRFITHEQLVIEVKRIYTGLAIVEARCIDIDGRESTAAQENNSANTAAKYDQWQSLVALHKQLLHEHHDFLLASQHPSSSLALKRLVARYEMPSRMWRHGIHAPLEFLRERLPDSREHIIAFIYIAYSMLTVFHEITLRFGAIWIKCLSNIIKPVYYKHLVT